MLVSQNTASAARGESVARKFTHFQRTLMIPQCFSRLARSHSLIALAIFSVLAVLASPGCRAQEVGASSTPDYSKVFDKTDAMIPARDGVKLHTEIYAPKKATGPLPIILERTPYGLGDDKTGFSKKLVRYEEMIPEGYIFVFQDIRGRYGSEGTFVMQRPVRDSKNSKSIDEGTDTYDTIDWLIKNVPRNNGRVGVIGTSYPGFLAIMAGINPDATHPAVKAISPQAPMIDVWRGDDFFHNGAFRQTYGYDYAFGLESSKQSTFGKLNED